MSFRALLERLARAEVELVVVGGVSAVLQGVPATTFDLDVVPAREGENLRRLARVLRELEACYREHLPRRLEPREEDLASDGHHLLATRLGPLDLLGTVAGGRDFDDLVARSRSVDLGEGLVVRVLDLAALVELKEASGREKDRAQLPLLRRVLAERGEPPAEP